MLVYCRINNLPNIKGLTIMGMIPKEDAHESWETQETHRAYR